MVPMMKVTKVMHFLLTWVRYVAGRHARSAALLLVCRNPEHSTFWRAERLPPHIV